MASELLAHHPVIKTITDYCALFFFTVLFVVRLTVYNQNTVFQRNLDYFPPHLLSVPVLFICNTVRFICYLLYSIWSFTHILVLYICLFIF